MKKKHNRILVSSLFMTILCIAALALIAPLPGGGWWFGAQVQNVNRTSTAVATITVYDYDRVTGLQVQNVSGSTINITVVYDTIYENYQDSYCPGGEVIVQYNNLPAGASHTFNITQDLPYRNCFAPVTITANGNIAAIVNEPLRAPF
jgi:hypothetical protein